MRESEADVLIPLSTTGGSRRTTGSSRRSTPNPIVIGVRGALVLVGIVLLGSTAAALLAIISAAAALTLALLRRGPEWSAILLDALAIGVLIAATGGASSPLLVMTLLLVVVGGVTGEGRDALLGWGAGLVVLLTLLLLDGRSQHTALPGIVLYSVAGGILALGWWRGRAFLQRVQDDAVTRAALMRERDDARCAVEWQRQAVRSVAAAQDDATLARVISEQASRIGAADAVLETSGAPGTACYPLDDEGGRVLRIARPRATLTCAQHEALTTLAALAGARALALSAHRRIVRHSDGLAALWECTGALRASDGIAAVREANGRLAQALGLNWIGVLSHDGQQGLRALALARGDGRTGGVRIDPIHQRIASEALQTGRTLVRREDGATLLVVPIGGAPALLLAAHGDTTDTAVQQLLIIFGGMAADRLAEDQTSEGSDAPWQR